MHRNDKQRFSGFSLIELMVAMALGLIILGAASQAFKAGMTTSSLVSNRAEMQQNTRAALDLISKDISMAGAGLPPAGLQLPTGSGSTLSKVACNQLGQCYLNNQNYAIGTVATAPTSTVSNYMYGVLPGSNNGMEKVGATSISGTIPAMASSGIIPDSITVAYVDFAPQLNLFKGSFTDATGTVLNLAPPIPFPAGVTPASDPAAGIKVGDLLLVATSIGSCVGEVTSVAPYLTNGATVTFASYDVLNINQPTAAAGNMKGIVSPGSYPGPWVAASPSVSAQRLQVISYFLEVPAVGTPRLMRQVNGATAQPVADNIIDLQFSYDLCDSGNTGGTCATTQDPIAISQSPTQIHKVNIKVLGQSLVTNGKDSQNMQLTSAVSTRNLSFKDRYQ